MKKGSALLIVLGMISFMLFSGIAFSVYMRQTRLPSSFLRRTSVTRQLAKAALAEAMTAVDSAIGDDPHPGVRKSSQQNYWNHRVMVGQSTDYTDSTVSTLTMEGLAYLPPSIINEARYYSRHTPTAAWQKFRFEAGRYAFCAIDVSDYFDVNRALADRPRSSAASRRVTLAHIFEKGGGNGLHATQSAGQAEAWDKWLEDDVGARKVDDTTDKITFSGKMPLVSLADFNLALGKDTFGNIKSPFVKYLDSSGGVFYPDAGDSEDDEIAEAYRAMTFVTDSHFREATTEEKDLSSSENQPFERQLMTKNSRKSYDAVIGGAYDSRSTLWDDYYLTFLSRLGMCALCDYLDEDSVPVSLAIPTCERTPMICAVRAEYTGGKVKIVKYRDPESETKYYAADGKGTPSNEGNSRQVSCWLTYRLSGAEIGQGAGYINLATIYPFPHEYEDAQDSFKLTGKVALFFTKNGEDIPLITGNASDKLRPEDIGADTTEYKDGVIYSPFGNGESVPITQTTPKNYQGRLQSLKQGAKNALPVGKNVTDKKFVFKCLRRWTQTKNEDTGEWEPATMPSDAEIVSGKSDSGFHYIKSDGTSESLLELITGNSETKLKLNMAVWARIQNGDGKTVDLVPAGMADDQTENGMSSGSFAKDYRKRFGDGTHLLKFTFNSDQPVLTLSPSELDKEPEAELTLDAKTLVCADPRYNHSPYNWFSVDEQDVGNAWTANNHSGDSGRDGDYYMATSDQGYLQSIYELAMLPRTTDPVGDSRGADVRYGNLTLLADYGKAGSTKHPDSFGDCINADNMWKTYNPFPFNGRSADAFDDLGFISGLDGLMVNPYSDSTEVLAAAFANTPIDWHVASTNRTANTACELGADDFNKEYAWNAYSSDQNTRLPWDAVLDIAENFHDRLRNNSSQDWQDVFRNLWNNANDERVIAGVNLDNLDQSTSTKFTSVDRKFLYGFWHDCFAANQQLFLVFVRAEPMMMGGGVAGNAPPQLSSRAVALVWRDPEKRKVSGGSSSGDDDSYIPHAMRVLFYHPLD